MRIQQLLQLLSRSAKKPPVLSAWGEHGASNPALAHPDIQPLGLRPDRLVLQAAVIHHLEWCVLFNEHLSVSEARVPGLAPLPCAAESGLGLWLEQMRQSPARDAPWLAQLNAEHAHFHGLAQQALNMARHGRMDLASTLLNTDFERSRARVLQLLRNMQKG